VVAFPGGASKVRPDALDRLLSALDITIIQNNESARPNTTKARGKLQRILDQHGEQHLILVLRTILESESNSKALIDPVICAVSTVMLKYPAWPETGLRWIEAFDDINLLHLHNIVRPLKPDEPARSALAGIIVEKLWPIFTVLKVKPPKKVKVSTDAAKRALEKGLALLAQKGPHANSQIPRELCEQLGIEPQKANYYMMAARRYGDRQQLVARLPRNALFALSMPSLPTEVRKVVEQRLAAGEKVMAKEIRALAARAKHRAS
jgi:hypothetical protein